MTEHILHLWNIVESYSKHHFSLSMCQFYLCYVICILINEDIITYVVVNIYIRIFCLKIHNIRLSVTVCFLNSKNRCVITHYIKCYDSHSSKIIHLLVFYFGSLITHATKIIHLFDFQKGHANRFAAEPQGMWIH